LNQYPELKEFLEEGEAEWYEGITVRYVHGRTAILTISDDGTVKEKITLHKLKDREQMHKLMKTKGFALKPENRERITQEKNAQLNPGKAKETGEHKDDDDDDDVDDTEDRRHSLPHNLLSDLHRKREDGGSAATEMKRRKKDELIAMAGPKESTMFILSVAGGAAMVGLAIMGMASRRKIKKSNRGGRR
jgi:hypothetical protein